MKKLKQLFALLQMSLGGVPQRLASVLVTVIGITSAVGVLVAMLAMGVGARQLSMHNVRADRADVVSKPGSNLDRAGRLAIMDMPGIRKDAEGKPLATASTIVLAPVRRKIDNKRMTVGLLAVDRQYFKVYPEMRITMGRVFQPAVRELIVGKTRHEQANGLDIGDRIRLRGAEWTIVGEFDIGGGGAENGLVGDFDTVTSAYQVNSASVSAVLETPAAFDTLQKALQANPTLTVELRHEAESADLRSKGLRGILNFVSYFVGAVMAIGATLGAINVMYSMVDGRKREIATLRAIGFSPSPIVISVLIESLVLALPGAILGVLVAWVFFNGNAVSPMGISFKLTVTPALALLGITWALLMGLIGGVMPAVRAARVPVATALRAT